MVASMLKKIGNAVLPPPEQHDGRDQWPSRASFLLATIGGAVGMGNMLRFPSQVYNNSGLQWFIPYLIAVLFLAIPCLMLEVALGQAFRAGSVVSYNNVHNRLKGTGLGLVYIGFVVSSYFVPILSWVMVYFRHSFSSPLPWQGGVTQEEMLANAESFWADRVIRAPDPVLNDATGYMEYAETGLVGELVGWSIFTWFVVWLCMFRGVGLTGRVVYFTMGLPIIMMIIIIGRAVSLDNAGEGIKLYFASWHSDKLADRSIWQAASGQVFFSTGVGFGYYTAYSSYNRKFSNPVQDAWIIAVCNCSFEILSAFAAFGVVGYLGMHPDTSNIEVGTYSLGFIVYPAVLAEMPASQFFSVIFFFTLMLIGISSTFAMLDAAITMIMDSEIGRSSKYSRPAVVSTVILVCVLVGLAYNTEFGYHLTNGIDYGINNVSLVFVVFSEALTSTSVYRYKDVTGQVGLLAWIVFNACYLGALILGVALGNGVSAPVGAGVGLGLAFVGFAASTLLAKTPDAQAPKFFEKNFLLKRFYFLAFYSGNQLRHDLNIVVSQGTNWRLPFLWPPLLRFIASPILMIILSFAYPEFISDYKNDPIYIFGFAAAHVVMITCIGGFVVPRWFNIFIPNDRMDDGTRPYYVNILADSLDGPSEDSGDRSPDKTSVTKAEDLEN